MTTLNEKEKRDFVSQTIVILQQNEPALTEAGFDPGKRISALKEKQTVADEAEGKQKKAQAAAIKATNESNNALKAAYKDASSIISLIEGLLGKDNELVHKLRQLRA
ncbi:hypothetical protein [Maribellus maritimus]|uniref:hypothetical protein n=1 Tax=Maribellus maritimus TaxID=2870838 RepID=UPI001EEA06D5|nr:hypothetical protein [Maribellus maritimus]MCG6187449.1 hypothetical protein [Maribellus maritimus]